MAFIKEPKLIKPLEKVISFAEKKIGNRMEPARLLMWTPKAFVSSMILEALITAKKGRVSPRMLKLIRMQVSMLIGCPFCIDMNSVEFRDFSITEEEIHAMAGIKSLKGIKSLSQEEKLVLLYVRGLVRTPIKLNDRLVAKMTSVFNEKEYAAIVTTIAQVDYWTRVIQGFGITPAGFLDTCDRDMMMNTKDRSRHKKGNKNE